MNSDIFLAQFASLWQIGLRLNGAHENVGGLGDKPNELTTNRNKKSDGILLIHIGLYIQITLNIYNLFINK